MKLIMLLLATLSIFLVGCTVQEADNNRILQDDVVANTPNAATPDVVIKLDGENFNFVLNGVVAPELRVKEGDLVRVEFQSIDGFHDFVIDEFNARTNQVTVEDGVVFVEFIANGKGTYEYYCSVGNHREQGMKGAFIVE